MAVKPVNEKTITKTNKKAITFCNPEGDVLVTIIGTQGGEFLVIIESPHDSPEVLSRTSRQIENLFGESIFDAMEYLIKN